MKVYGRILIIILVLVLALPASPVSASAFYQAVPSAAIYLTAPLPNPAVAGEEVSFNLVISVTDVTPGVSGIEVFLGYDPDMVESPQSPSTAVAEAWPDFFGTSSVSVNELLPAAECPGGASPCVHLVLAGPPQVTQTETAVRFHFQTLAGGEACFTVLDSTLVDADGFEVTHTPAEAQCVEVALPDVDLDGTVLRQGTPANPNAGAGSLACTTISLDSGLATYTDTSGAFTFHAITEGAYTISAAYPGYLSAVKDLDVTLDAPIFNAGSISLRGGDVNGDKAINILDIGSIISKFGKSGMAVKSASADCSVTDEPADINDDGLVNISDLAIAAGNWGSVGPTVWP